LLVFLFDDFSLLLFVRNLLFHRKVAFYFGSVPCHQIWILLLIAILVERRQFLKKI